MNKYIFALILTLLGWTQIKAQNTDLRKAPDVPKFQVTVNIGDVANGSVTAKVGNTEIKTGAKVAYGSTVDFTIVTNSGYKLTEVANGSDKVTSFTDVKFADGKTTYQFTSKALEGEANFKFTTAEKETLSNLNITNLDQTLSSLEYIQEVKVLGNLGDFTVKYLYSGSSATNPYEPFDAKKFTDFGTYSIMITRAEDKDYKAFSQEYTLKVTQKMATITYSVDPVNMGESLTATLNGSDGKQIENGSQVGPSSVLTFTFIPKSGYRLEKILWKELNRYYTDFRSQLKNGQSVYTFGTPSISDNSSFVFYTVEKDNRKDLENLTINNLEQTAGALQDVTVSGAPEGVTLKVKYQLDGKWTETLDKNLKASSYKVLVVCAEDLNYKEWSTEATLVVKEAEQPTEPEQPKIEIVLNTEKLTATSVEVGKPLSTSILSGGYAIQTNGIPVVGVFSWKNPSTIITTAGESEQTVIFTPEDLHKYKVAEKTIKVTAIQNYTVTIPSFANGRIVIKNGNAENRYPAGTKLEYEAIPNEHYTVANAINTVTVNANITLEATFTAITRKVTFPAEITVLNAGQSIQSGADVIEGAVLTVTAAKEGSQLTELTCNDLPVINNTVTVADQDLTFAAKFENISTGKQLVTVDYSDAASKNGKVQLYDTKGNIIESGSAVAEGDTIQVVAVPDYGYVADKLTVTGATASEGLYKVGTSPVTVKQTFKKATYKVTLPTADKDHVAVTLSAADLNAVAYQTELTISSATPADGYKLVAILVNGTEVAIGGKFTVTADTKVNAIVEELPLLQFADTEQSRVYTTQKGVQNFILRTIPAGVAGLQISYKQGDTKVENPTEVGTYDVFVAYTAEATNKVYSLPTEKIGTFTITKAQYPAPIPTKDEVDGKKYKWEGNASGNFRTAIYILTTEEQKNYEDPEFNILYGDNVPKANLTTGPQTKATLRAAGDVTITLQANGGSIVAYNGPTEIGNVDTYVGQTITLKALPDKDHTVKGISWKVGEESKTANADGSLTLALPETEMTITATFAEKEEAAKPSVTIHNGTYNGVVYGGASVTDVPAGWNVFFKQNETMISEPIAAGDYEVYVSRSEDADYKATTHYVGTMEIAKATPILSDLKGSEILKGSPLSQSVISGTSNAEGSFAWVNPDQVMHTEGDMEAEVKFTSTNPNYADATGTAKVTVKAQAAGVTTRKLTLTVNGAEHGTVKILLDGTEVISGTAISKGQVLKVTATANRGYILESVKINGTAVTESYTVGEEGDVEIVVTFKKDSTQGGGDEPIDPSNPETISDPVVAERTATTAVITWEKIDGATGYKLHLYAKKGDATPLKTYEFDAEGNLKAAGISFTLTGLTAGESYYVETVAITPSGEVKRGIELTGTPTGIEAIAEGSQLYTIKGAIVIVPTTPIEVMIISANGRPIFHDEVSGYTQVTANAGIYVVVLKKGNEQVVEKVVVK